MENKPHFKKRHLKAEALSAVRKGEIDIAIEKYEQYLKLNPQDHDAWSGLGGAYRRKNDIEKAIENYEKGYQINTQSTYALVNIVVLRTARNTKGDVEKLKKYLPIATKLTKQIINKGKGDFWTWYDFATLQLLQGETEEAIRTFNYAVELTPKTAKENFQSVLNQLNFLKEQNPSIQGISRMTEIISRYIEVDFISPSQKSSLKNEALSAVRKGEIDNAIKKYEEYLELYPEDYDAWAGLGGAYRRKGNIAKAIESYEKAYEVNSQSTYALVNIVVLRTVRNSEDDKGKLEKYFPAATKLSRQIINSGKGDFWTWYDLSTLQLIHGETEEAIRSFNYAIELTPKTAKENFESVLSQLDFLKIHSPSIKGVSRIIEIINRHIEDSIQSTVSEKGSDSKKYYDQPTKQIIEDFCYLENRIEEQRKWHSDKSSLNKKSYYRFEICTLVSGSLIPVVNVISGIPDVYVRLLSSFLAAISVLSVGISKLYKFRENWLSYRTVDEALNREKELFLHQVGDYEFESQQQQRKMLVERVENILSSTTSKYISTHKAGREQSNTQVM